MDEQHLGAIRVSGELMRDHIFRTMVPGMWVRCESGLPDGAEFVRGYEDPAHNYFVFVYRHPSFPICRPGDPVTFLDVPQMSSIHLTLPLQPDTCQMLTALIGAQVCRAADTEGPQHIVGG